jgi:hypothetical protein
MECSLAQVDNSALIAVKKPTPLQNHFRIYKEFRCWIPASRRGIVEVVGVLGFWSSSVGIT